jgi:hypothetical protein
MFMPRHSSECHGTPCSLSLNTTPRTSTRRRKLKKRSILFKSLIGSFRCCFQHFEHVYIHGDEWRKQTRNWTSATKKSREEDLLCTYDSKYVPHFLGLWGKPDYLGPQRGRNHGSDLLNAHTQKEEANIVHSISPLLHEIQGITMQQSELTLHQQLGCTVEQCRSLIEEFRRLQVW